MNSVKEIFNVANSSLDYVSGEFLEQHGVELFIKRDDQIHSAVSGNKWRKLKYNIEACIKNGCDTLLTFGGAYSNHLVATAFASKALGLKSIGIVRGDELNSESNPTLQDCSNLGMQLHFVSRTQYNERYESQYHEELKLQFPSIWIVPEGGANYYGMIGCQEIESEINVPFDSFLVAQGTTTTSCGVLLGLKESQTLYVVPVLKGFDSKFEMSNLFKWSGFDDAFIEERLNHVQVLDNYHFGGYGKTSDELIRFISDFEIKYGVPLDQVYTGKAMYALIDQIESRTISDQKIVFLHTGGLQGKRSL